MSNVEPPHSVEMNMESAIAECVSPLSSWPEALRATLIAALSTRSQEVRAMLSTRSVESKTVVPLTGGNEEESLRLAMVRYFPRVSAGKAGEQDFSEYLRHLNVFVLPAGSLEDLRFIDAWHNAFECFLKNPPPSSLMSNFYNWLHAYSDALDCCLRELAR